MRAACPSPGCNDDPPHCLHDPVRDKARDQLDEVEGRRNASVRHGASDLLDQPRSSEMELLLAVRVDLIVLFTDQSNQTSVHTGTSVRKALRPDTPRRMKKAGPTDRVSYKQGVVRCG